MPRRRKKIWNGAIRAWKGHSAFWDVCGASVDEYLEDIKTVESLSGVVELEGELKALRRKTHQTIRKVTIDIEDRFHFNTAISAVMELVNAVYQIKRPTSDDKIALATVREALEAAVILLVPIVPHITEELWQMLGHKTLAADIPGRSLIRHCQ